MRPWLRQVLCGFALVAAGCVESPGSVLLDFRWEPPPPDPDRPLHIRGTLEQRGGGEGSGEVLARISPLRVQRGLTIDLDGIPNGANRVLTFEVTDGPWTNAEILHRAETEPFELRAGETTRVDVVIRPYQDVRERPGPDPLDPEDVALVHAPLGSELLAQVEGYAFVGVVGRPVEGLQVICFHDPDPTQNAKLDARLDVELARVPVEDDGSFVFEDIDPEELPAYCAVLDAEGNLSDADPSAGGQQGTLVDRIRSVSRPGEASPITIQVLSRTVSVRAQPSDAVTVLTPEQTGALQQRDDGIVAATVKPHWARINGSSVDGAQRKAPAVAADLELGTLLSVGGVRSDGSDVTDTLNFDGLRWTTSSTNSPAGRAATMTYDHLRREFLLFTGDTEDAGLWRYADGDWIEAAQPFGPGITTMSLAYHAEAGVSVLALERNAGLETWLWDGERWTQYTQTPTPRLLTNSLTYDADRKKVVGWHDPIGSDPPETYEWDWNGWRTANASARPERRIRFAIGYDRGMRRTVFQGGWGGEYFDDLWVWNGTSWSEVDQSGFANHAQAVRGHRAVYSPLNQGVEFIGGEGRSEIIGWRHRLYRRGDFTALGAFSFGEAVVGDPMFTYDATRHRIILGLSDDRYMTRRGTFWNLPLRAPTPLPQSATMVYDEGLTHALIYGGLLAGSTSTRTLVFGEAGWVETATNSESPGERLGAAMVYDRDGARTLLFGGLSEGQENNELWAFADGAWSLVAVEGPSPPPRRDHRMVYDRLANQILLFGGRNIAGPLGDVWAFSGDTWTEVQVDSGPAARFGMGLSYDTTRNRTVLFAGESESGPLNDVWEFDGAEWFQLSEDSGLGPRTYPMMVYDPDREATVVRGGTGAEGQVLSVTWELYVPKRARAGLAVQIQIADLAAAREDFSQIEIAAVLGGHNGLDDEPNVAISVWNQRHAFWEQLGTGEGTLDAPTEVRAALPYPLEDYVNQEGQLHALLSSGYGAVASGRSPSINVDTLEIEFTSIEGAGTTNVCGNGDLRRAERCDDGNQDSGDGCSQDCRVERYFNCVGSPSLCAACGDGVVAPGESCDDGEVVSGASDTPLNGDGCNDLCQQELP